MPKPTLEQLRGLLSGLDFSPRYAARVLQQRGIKVTENAMRNMVRGKTSCPPSIYIELLAIQNDNSPTP